MYKTLHPVTYYFYPLLAHDLGQGPSDWKTFNTLLGAPKPTKTENLLYLHIPFCQDLCRFCPFHVKVNNSEEVYTRYVNAMLLEMEQQSRIPYMQDMTFSAVYFGGGSPSILANELIVQLFKGIKKYFRFSKDVEISFEGEPDSLGDPHLLDILKEHGTSRLSFGLQTYDQETRDMFKIRATLDHVDRVTQNARDRKFKDINVDMMYDLPGQTPQKLEEDLRRLVSNNYDSVDYYNLHYFAFPSKMKVDMSSGALPGKPDEAMHFHLAQQVTDFMVGSGYHHLSDQIYARYDKISEYFRILWGGGFGEHAAETIAIGASARGYVNGYCYMNQANSKLYMTQLEAGEPVYQRISSTLEDPRNRGLVFMAKFFEINGMRRSLWNGLPQSQREQLVSNDYVVETKETVRITRKGKLWTTNLMLDLFEPEQHKLAMASAELLQAKAGTRTGSF